MEPELDFGLGRIRHTTASVSVMGRGVFGAIPESGSASESQSQTRGTRQLSVSGWREQLLCIKVAISVRSLSD